MSKSKVIIPNKVSIKLNQELSVLPYFSLGEVIKGGLFKEDNEKFTVDLNIVKEPLSYFKEKGHDQFSTFFKVSSNSIYYQRDHGGISCKILVENIEKNNIKVYCNKAYLRFVKFKMDGLYPVGVHLTDILLLKIIADDDLVIHGASLQNKNGIESFLLIAPPDTGKTYTTWMLLKKNYKFLGEDLSYYDSKKDSLFCMPYTSTWGHRFSFKKVDVSKIPFIGLFSTSNKKTVDEIFGPKSVTDKSKLSRIYILEKSSSNSLKKINYSEDLFKKVMAIQRNEFTYFKNPLIRAYEYFHTDLNVDDVFNKEAENFKKLLKEKELFLVKGTSYEKFHELIDANEMR